MKRQVLLAVLMVGICSRADALVLCAPKKGTGPVTVRTACTKNEMQLDPVTLGLQGPPGPMGPHGVPGQKGPQGLAGPGVVVKDANGVFVGVFSGPFPLGPQADMSNFSFDVWAGALRDVESTTVFIPLTFSPPNFLRKIGLCYESTDCSGTELMQVIAPSSQFFVLGAVRGTTLYYNPSVGPTVTVRSFSQSPVDQSSCERRGWVFIPPDTCCVGVIGQNPVAPPGTLDLSGFVLPFHLEVQP